MSMGLLIGDSGGEGTVLVTITVQIPKHLIYTTPRVRRCLYPASMEAGEIIQGVTQQRIVTFKIAARQAKRV